MQAHAYIRIHQATDTGEIMPKKRVSVYLDEDLLKEARTVGINISAFLQNRLEEFLRNYSNSELIQPERGENGEIKSRGRDLNPRPAAYEAAALPD